MSGPSGRFDRTVFRAERYSRFISRETSDCAYATQIVRNALKISKCIMRVINPARERNVSTLGGSFFFFFISLSFSFFFFARPWCSPPRRFVSTHCSTDLHWMRVKTRITSDLVIDVFDCSAVILQIRLVRRFPRVSRKVSLPFLRGFEKKGDYF